MSLYEHSSCSWKFRLLCRIRQAVKAVSARLHNWVWQSVNTNLHGKSWYENMLEKIFHATVFLWDFDLQQRWRLAEHMAWRFSACRENHQNLETLVSFQGEIYVTIGFFFYFNLHHLNPLFAPKTPKTKFHSCRPRQGFLSHQIFDFHTARISPMMIHMKRIFGIKSFLQRSPISCQCGCRQRCSPAIGRCSFGTPIITTQCLAIGGWNRDESMDGSDGREYEWSNFQDPSESQHNESCHFSTFIAISQATKSHLTSTNEEALRSTWVSKCFKKIQGLFQNLINNFSIFSTQG